MSDVLINNAGLAKGTNKIQDARVEDWEQMINTNLSDRPGCCGPGEQTMKWSCL